MTPITYNKLVELKAHIEIVQWPNVCRLAALFAPHDAAQQNTLLQHAKQCSNPGFAYFKDRFFEFHTRGDLKEVMNFFKSARLLNPPRFCAVYNAQELPSLLDKFKFLNDDEKKQLVSEAPAYIAHANDIRQDIDLVQWWCQN